MEMKTLIKQSINTLLPYLKGKKPHETFNTWEIMNIYCAKFDKIIARALVFTIFLRCSLIALSSLLRAFFLSNYERNKRENPKYCSTLKRATNLNAIW